MAFTERTRLEAMQQSAFRCCVCHAAFVEVHHIVPQAAGGDDTLKNAAPLCARCHDLYGGNPDKRKQIRQMRDSWWQEIEVRRASLKEHELSRLVPTPDETGGEERLRTRPAILYHLVFAEENFEQAATSLLGLVQWAQRHMPYAPRHLFIDIEGHKTENGAFDGDMWELQHHFVIGFLSPFLTWVQMPLVCFEVPGIQRNDVPEEFQILPPDYPLGKAAGEFEGVDMYVGDAESWIRFNKADM